MIRSDDLRGRHDRAAGELLAAGERFETAVIGLISELVQRAAPEAAWVDLTAEDGPDGDVYAFAGLRDSSGRVVDSRPLDAVRDLLDTLLADLASVSGTSLPTLLLDPPGPPR